jgi:hypothetical protein
MLALSSPCSSDIRRFIRSAPSRRWSSSPRAGHDVDPGVLGCGVQVTRRSVTGDDGAAALAPRDFRGSPECRSSPRIRQTPHPVGPLRSNDHITHPRANYSAAGKRPTSPGLSGRPSD